jgi:transcriptional regulator with XRE-family HTH domain
MAQPRGRPPQPLDPDASRAARLGAEIRARRQARGLTLEALAQLTGYSPQHISEAERANATVSSRFVAACDHALQASGWLVEQLPGVIYERAAQRDEREAARRRTDGREVPAGTRGPGLPVPLPWALQPQAGEDVDPLSRRSLFGVGVGAALGLGATTAPAAAREIDPELVSHWMRLLRVLDHHDAMFGPHDVLPAVRREIELIAEHRRIAHGELRNELLRVEAHWAEFASFLHDDAGDARRRDSWADRALRLGNQAGYADMVAYVLMRRSQWTAVRDDAPRAIAFAQAAERTHGASNRIRALCALKEAQGHALADDRPACERSLADAYGLLDPVDTTQATWSDLGSREASPSSVLAYDARCWLWLEPHRAITMFEDVLRLWPRDRMRSRGVHQARLALACAAAGESERAAIEGIKALAIARSTRSDTAVRELTRLDDRLAACDMPAAMDFREALGAL